MLIHTYIHAYIHTYIHACIHTYIHTHTYHVYINVDLYLFICLPVSGKIRRMEKDMETTCFVPQVVGLYFGIRVEAW